MSVTYLDLAIQLFGPQYTRLEPSGLFYWPDLELWFNAITKEIAVDKTTVLFDEFVDKMEKNGFRKWIKERRTPAPNPPAAAHPPTDRPTPATEEKTAADHPHRDPASVTALRLQLRKNDFDPIPVEGKRPHMKGWQQKFDVSEEEIRRWEKTRPRERNTGILAKNAPGLDVDITIEAAAKTAEAKAREFLEERGDIHVRFGAPPKRLIPLQTDEPFTKLYRAFKAPDGSEQRLEILGDGQQYVVDGIHPDTHKPYTCFGGKLETIKREDLPYVHREDAEQLLDAMAKVLIEEHGFMLAGTSQAVGSSKQLNLSGNSGEDPTKHPVAEDPTAAPAYVFLNPESATALEQRYGRIDTPFSSQDDLGVGIGSPPTAEPDRIAAALAVVPNDADWDGWNRVGMATWRATSGSPEGFAAFDAWSKKSPKYNADSTRRKWEEYFKSPPTRIGAGTIFELADQASPGWREEYEARNDNGQEEQQQTESSTNNADEAGIPPDTLAAIKDNSKDGRSKRFFNILMVLKARGFTIDSSVALFELYPKGIAAHYSGRLRHAVGEIWAKLETGGNTPNWLNTQTNEAKASLPAILSQKDFLAGFIAPDYILDGILQRRFIYSFTAVTGHGKTAIALLLAQAIGSANPNATFGIRHAAEKGRVIYFVGENPDDVRCRVIGANSKRDDDPELDRIHYIPGVFDIAGLHKELVAAIDKLGGVDFIIIDTSAAYFLGDDEISNTQMGEHARTLRSLTQLPGGPCVLVLCHPVKHVTEPSQLLPRGGGAFVAEMDGNLTGWKHDETLVTLHHSADKWRGPGFEPITFKLEKIITTNLMDSKGRLLPTVHAVAVSGQEEEEQKASAERDEDELLAQVNGKRSVADLARACNWMLSTGEPHKSKVDRVMKRLLDAKLVKRGRRYRLTDEGKNLLKQTDEEDEVVENRSGAVGSNRPFHALRGIKQRETVPCAYCSQTGDVYKFADGRLPKGQRHHADLHEECAEPFFTGQQKPGECSE